MRTALRLHVRQNVPELLGVITIWHADLAHHGTLGGVWGTPEPEDLAFHYPRIPFVEITKSAERNCRKNWKKVH